MIPDLAERSEDSQARRRAAITLAAIALVAVVVALVMVTLARGPSGKTRTVLASVRTSAEPARPSRTDTSSSHQPPVATASKPPTSTTSCPSRPCTLTGDPGNVVAAINAFRASQAEPAVTGSATPSAGSCAVHSGDTPYCAGFYYWMPVSRLQGAEVVSKIAGFGDGRSWLLDPHLTKVAVGWAEASPNQYQCAVLDVSQRVVG